MELYLKRALERDKKSIFLKKNLLNLYLHQQNFSQAEKLAKELKSYLTDDSEIAILTARLHLSQNRADMAIQALERYLEKNPKEEAILNLLISIYLQQKQWDQALEKLDRLNQIYPQEIFIEIFRARIFREKGEYLKAKEHYLKALDRKTDNRALLVEILKYLELNKDFESIEKILLKYISEHPDDKDIMRLLFGFYFDQGDWEKSEKLLKNYLLKHKDQPEILFYLGLTLEQKGNQKEAIQIYQSIPEDSPWYLDAQRRVFNYLKKQNPDEAKELINKIKIRKSRERAQYIFLLHAYEDLDLCEEGVKLGEEALKQYNNDPDVILAVALNYACLDNYEKVLNLVEPLLEKYPNDAYILNFIGYSLVELDRELSRAEELLIKADKLKPNDPYILDSLGWLYYKRGDLKLAFQYLERATSLLTEDEAVILWHFGDVLRALSYKERACEVYNKALRSVIHQREKQRILDRLKSCPQ